MRKQSVNVLLAAAVLLGVAAIAAAQWFRPGPDAAPRAASHDTRVPAAEAPVDIEAARLADTVDSLGQILEREIDERRNLELEIEQLRAQLDALQARIGQPVSSDDTADALAARQQQIEENQRSQEQRLAEAGFTRQQIAAIDRIVAEATMRQIELDDRARREGWVNTPEYFAAASALTSGPESVRNYLGDASYDRYLYASGNPNRVAIGSVVSTSPAERAGLRPGDVILSYGGTNIYSTGELVRLRSEGQPGSRTVVRIIRDGQVTELTIPRGPMGINTVPSRIDPDMPEG